MGHVVIRGLENPFELCHVCVMIYKAEFWKNEKFQKQLAEAEAKPSHMTTVLMVPDMKLWAPEEAITEGISTIGTYGPICLTHIAAHDQEKYDAAVTQKLKQQQIDRWNPDVNRNNLRPRTS